MWINAHVYKQIYQKTRAPDFLKVHVDYMAEISNFNCWTFLRLVSAMVETSGSKRKAEEVEEEPLKAKKLGKQTKGVVVLLS